MKKIAILGNKGGTGKTAIAVHLAYAISEREPVLFIDTDYAQHSGLNWLLGRWKTNYELKTKYSLDGNPNLEMMSLGKEDIGQLDKIVKESKEEDFWDYVIIDGRPEPEVTAEVLKVLDDKNDVVILPIDIGDDSIKQTQDLREKMTEYKLKIKSYVIVNKMSQSRISTSLMQKIEDLGFDVIADLSFIEYMKWAERDGVPLWKIRGAKRTKHCDIFHHLGLWIIRGRI